MRCLSGESRGSGCNLFLNLLHHYVRVYPRRWRPRDITAPIYRRRRRTRGVLACALDPCAQACDSLVVSLNHSQSLSAITMSQVPSTAATPPPNFSTIIAAALEEYKKKTKKDIAAHPLATQLKSCESPSAILALLRAQVQASDESQSADEKLTKWLDPTVNVLYAFSAILGDAVGLVLARVYAARDRLSDVCPRCLPLRVRFLPGSVSSSK